MSCLKDLAGYGGVEIIEIRGRMNLLTMKRLVLFLAVAILSGLGLQSCDREENNGSDNNGGVNAKGHLFLRKTCPKTGFFNYSSCVSYAHSSLYNSSPCEKIIS